MFICFYTNMLFIVFAFFFFALTKLSWPKLTCKVEKVVVILLHYLFQWKMLLCNIWCLLLDAVTPLRQEQNGKAQNLLGGFWLEEEHGNNGTASVDLGGLTVSISE